MIVDRRTQAAAAAALCAQLLLLPRLLDRFGEALSCIAGGGITAPQAPAAALPAPGGGSPRPLSASSHLARPARLPPS